MWTDEGEGVGQMTILLHKPYLVKVTTKWGSKIPKILTTWFMDDSTHKFSKKQTNISRMEPKKSMSPTT